MDIRQARVMGRTELDELGLKDWRLTFDKRPRRRLGQCRYVQREIGLTLKWVELTSWDEVRKVLRHEAAHALVGPGHGHGTAFKLQAYALGAPGRCTFATENTVPGNIDIVCAKCGVVGTRHRMPKRRVGMVHRVCRYPVTFERKG